MKKLIKPRCIEEIKKNLSVEEIKGNLSVEELARIMGANEPQCQVYGCRAWVNKSSIILPK